MKITEVEDFAIYEVYTVEDNKVVNIAVCKDYTHARFIACVYANNDEDYKAYYVSNVSRANQLVWGGGWYHRFYKNKDTGEIETDSLD